MSQANLPEPMIVEFIGCSGAGKTTLARKVCARVRRDSPTTMALDLVMDRPGLRWIRQPQLINLVADVTVLPLFLGGWGGHADLTRFANDRLRRHAPSRFAWLNYMVNVERRVGMQLLARRQGSGTILSDEGALLLAYQLFVYSGGAIYPQDLERFAALVPLPDLIIYVRAPLDALLDRAMHRVDRRRELANGDRAQLERWMVRADQLFDGLASVPEVRERLLIVENGDIAVDDRGAIVDRIVAFIDDPAPVGQG